MRRELLTAWVAALLLCSGAVAAQVTATREYLRRMDTDGDARVSLAEYQAWMGYAFTAMDRDGDGVLRAAELPGGRGGPVTRAMHAQRLADAFGRQDLDRDGMLETRELASPPRAAPGR